MEYLLSVAFFCCAFFLGSQIALHSWGGVIFVAPNMYSPLSPRTPAAIRKVYDYSHLEGSALTSASQNRLLENVKLIQMAQGVSVTDLGHFVIRNEQGERIFACEYYDSVELTFTADGMAESGEHPTMLVQSPCQFNQNVNRLDPIWIPTAKILQEPVGNLNLSYNDEGAISFHFKNMGLVWPKHWLLSSIRLFNSANQTHELVVDEVEMRKIYSRLLSLSF